MVSIKQSVICGHVPCLRAPWQCVYQVESIGNTGLVFISQTLQDSQKPKIRPPLTLKVLDDIVDLDNLPTGEKQDNGDVASSGHRFSNSFSETGVLQLIYCHKLMIQWFQSWKEHLGDQSEGEETVSPQKKIPDPEELEKELTLGSPINSDDQSWSLDLIFCYAWNFRFWVHDLIALLKGRKPRLYMYVDTPQPICPAHKDWWKCGE